MSRDEIFLASKEAALEILDLIEDDTISGEILRVSSLDIVRDKFSTISEKNKINKKRLDKIDPNEVLVAMDREWITKEEITEEALKKVLRRGANFQDDKLKEDKETLWSERVA